ncbi:MAG: hypothetical protein ACWGN2_11800 [Anaerolineales bacterium]
MMDKKIVSTFDELVTVWVNPNDEHEIFTVGDIFDSYALKSAVLTYLAEIEDGKSEAIERFSNSLDELGISPDPCPLCGRYSSHSHEL